MRFGFPGMFSDPWQPAGYPLFLRGVREVTDWLPATVALQHLLMLMHQDALKAPRYRAVDAVRTLAFSIPGVGMLLRLRSRLIRRRRGSAA